MLLYIITFHKRGSKLNPLSYRESKLNRNERKFCPEIRTWQMDVDNWDCSSGAAQLLGQCVTGELWGLQGNPD